MNLRFIMLVLFCFLGLSVHLCFAQQPKLVLPIGHSDWIFDAQFSPDGKTIVTVSRDNTAKIWGTESGALLADLKGHSSWVKTAFFSPDGKKIVTASYDNTAKIWDTKTGGLLIDFNKHTDIIMSAIFSADGKKILTASKDNTSKLWDAATGSLILDLNGHTGWVYSSHFSPDCKKIVTASWDSTGKIWNAQSGELLVDLKGHTDHLSSAMFSPDGRKIITSSSDKTVKIWDAESGVLLADLKGHNGPVYSACFSPDGKKILTASSWDNVVKIWDTKGGSLINDLKGHSSGVYSANFSLDGKKIVTASLDSTIKLWDTETGAILEDLKGHNGPVTSACFSPDGKKILTASWDNVAKIWDIKGGSLINDLKGHSSGVYSANFSLDGKKIVTSQNESATIWDAISGKLISELKGHKGWVNTARFSPDGKYILTASLERTAKIWDAISGKFIITLKGHKDWVNSAKFSPDGKFIVTASSDSTAKIWDTQSWILRANLKGHTDLVCSISFSPDSKKVVTGSWDSTAKIWDAQSGRLLVNLIGHSNYVWSASFSSDGKKIVTASQDSTAKIWDVQSGVLLADLKGHTDEINFTSFSPDGKIIVTASSDGTAKIWDSGSGMMLKDLTGHSDRVYGVSFSPDNKTIVTASDDNTAKLWDIQSGILLADLKGHSYEVSQASFSPDGKKIITSSRDQTSKIWDINKGLLYTFFVIDNNDYLIVDNDNHYDGTEAARKMLYFTCGTEIVNLEQVKDQLWVPNLAERINNGETINSKTLDELNICGLVPVAEDISSKADEYHFKILPRRGGLGETVLYINGIEVKRYKAKELKNIGGAYELVIKNSALKNLFITGKENIVTVKAYISDNTISSRGVSIKETKSGENTTPPNLYAVMVGVSDYKGDELDLKYASKDANDISAVIKNAAKKLLNTDGVEHVFMYNLTTEKEHYQLPEKNSVKKLLGEIGKKATANDILLIFFAGHGVMQGKADNKQFYFLTAEASKASASSLASEVGISTAELTEWIKPANIKAQKRIMIFDACNSGQAIRDFVKMGNKDQGYVSARNNEKGQEIKAIDKLNEKSGLFILSASASNQDAYEMGRYSQGLLTYSLLKAIKQKPDILNDGKYLDVSRWFSAAKESVAELATESGARQEPMIVSNTNFNIGIVDDDVMAKIVLPLEKPLFASSNFQNADDNIAADNLGLNKLTDLQLHDISSRGTDATIVFAGSTVSKDAYSLSGRYTISDSIISIKVFIRQNNEVKEKIDLSGTNDKLEEFAALIASKTAEWVSKNK